MSAGQTSVLTMGKAYDLLRGGEDFYFLCSASGRVLLTTGSLKLFLEEDLTGRNLNDFLPDTLAANIIAASFHKESYDFRCELFGKHFRGVTEPNEEFMVIALFPVSEDGKAFIRKNSAQFISREISDQLGMMSASLDLLSRNIGLKLQGQALDGDEMQKKISMPISVINQSIMRLMRLSRNMLDCALYENGGLPLHLTEADMGAFCRDLARRLEAVGRKAQLDVRWTIPEQPVVCRFDEEKVERMILNLIANAVRAGQGAPITVELSERDNCVVITVTDNGGGIASETMSTAMNKHALAPADQGGTSGGAGFGLALLRSFAARHGGTFIMSSNADGTSARISLPKNLDKEQVAFNAVRPDYAGGFDHILLELSTVLSSEFYQKTIG